MKEADVRRIIEIITGQEALDDDITILGENPTPEAVNIFLTTYKENVYTPESEEAWQELEDWTDLPRAVKN